MSKMKAIKGVIEMGDRVRCKISGFEGVVTGWSKYISGCDRAHVAPQDVDKEGGPGKAWMIDVPMLELLEKGVLPVTPETAPQSQRGGPPTQVER